MPQDKQKSSTDRIFKRGALIEGNSAGKLSTPRWDTWGWWFWPLSALALAACTYWGARHIERQVGAAAPEIAAQEGIDTSDLTFTPDYRDVTVTGVLPEKLNAETLEQLLTDYRGKNGESIYRVQVNASARPVPVQPQKFADALINASWQDDLLVLSGTVPSEAHSTTIKDAAMQSFSEDQIQNSIRVLNLEPSFEDADRHINKLATVLSNLSENVSSADVTLDNNLLAGSIVTSSESKKAALQAKMTGLPVKVLVSQEHTAQDAPQVLSIAPVDTTPELDTQLVASKTANIDSTFEAIVSNQLSESASLQKELDDIYDRISENVVFETNSDTLKDSAYPVLDEIIAHLGTHPNPQLEVAGHTDNIGHAGYNQKLSQRRAMAVTKYLADNGINTVRLKAKGYGESRPLHSNTTADGRYLNRRVEFISYSSSITDE